MQTKEDMNNFERPPLQWNRNFLYERENVFKLVEIVLGSCCVMMNSLCYPNDVVLTCTNMMHSVTQLFSIVCVNVFFLIVTFVLALCNLCGITDSFYKFNFPVIEKKVYMLAVFMYLVSFIMVGSAFMVSTFVVYWFLPLVFTILTTVAYIYDLIYKHDGSIQAALCP
ncbi:hypothetical protein RB195_021493 [Necator americanus]|uniref:Uncharacterized protein n=1 Tax=Necator americanus TaxID=51031 RepID=A0ABR1EDV9_NECAM